MKRRTQEQMISELVDRGASLLHEIVQAQTGLTDLYRGFARTLVELRIRLKDPAGRTQAYRDLVAKMYAEAGVPTDAAANVQAAVRYHVGNELRTKFKADALEEAGLSPQGPRERQQSRIVPQGAVILDLTPEHPDTVGILEGVLRGLVRARETLNVEGIDREALISVLHEITAEVALFSVEAGAPAIDARERQPA